MSPPSYRRDSKRGQRYVAGRLGNRAPDYSANVGAGRTGERRRAKWTRANCAAAVARYLDQLPTGERSTERGYADWAATQPRGAASAMSTILALGGWEAVRREAIADDPFVCRASTKRAAISCRTPATADQTVSKASGLAGAVGGGSAST